MYGHYKGFFANSSDMYSGFMILALVVGFAAVSGFKGLETSHSPARDFGGVTHCLPGEKTKEHIVEEMGLQVLFASLP